MVLLGSAASAPDWKFLAGRSIPIAWSSIPEILTRLNVVLAGEVRGEATVTGIPDSLQESRCVWYNPGAFDQLEDELLADVPPEITRFHRRQVAVVLQFLEDWLPAHCTLADPPSTQRQASNKILQSAALAQIEDCGHIETRFLGDPREAKPGYVLKHISEGRHVSASQALYAQVATEESLSVLSDGTTTPIIAQRLLEYDTEFRTFSFGGERATVAIPRTRRTDIVDLQFYADEISRAHVCECPVNETIWSSIESALGLTTFAADYVLGAGRPYFFEVNPVFTMSWLPGECLDALAEAVARWVHRCSRG